MNHRGVVSVVSLLLVGPTFAQATAECGPTEEQWVGGFDGSHVNNPGDPLPLSIEVTRNAEGTLRVATDVDGWIPPVVDGDIGLKRLTWVISKPAGSFFPLRQYGADFGEVICSGGIVTSFTGYALDFLPGYGEVLFSDIELARV